MAIDRYVTIIAVSEAAHRVWPGFVAGENLARAVFLAPDVEALFDDAPEPVTQIVSLLRAGLRDLADDPVAIALVGELATSSATFARLWTTPHAISPSGMVQVTDGDSGWTTFDYRLQSWDGSPHIRVMTWTPGGSGMSGPVRQHP
ncbi:hypothetical protein ACI3KS_01755 [Microbacterium sp. ZW T5_45]|uniref:MmyB family transcriptional regulator n=1 Tax=Microbacterium sp. ZW T5_45 TaxID=3378080 RepID=UPI003854D31C